MSFLDRYTEEQKTGGFLSRYTEEPVVRGEPTYPVGYKYPQVKSYGELAEYVREKIPAIEEPNPLEFLVNVASGAGRLPFELGALGEQAVFKPKEAIRGFGEFLGRGALKTVASMRELPTPITPIAGLAEMATKAVFPQSRKSIEKLRKHQKALAKETFEQLPVYPVETMIELTAPFTIPKQIAGLPGKFRPKAKITPPEEIAFPGLKEKIVPTEKPIPPTYLEEVLGKALKKRGVTEKPAEIPATKPIEKIPSGQAGWIYKLSEVEKKGILEEANDIKTAILKDEYYFPQHIGTAKDVRVLPGNTSNLGLKIALQSLEREGQIWKPQITKRFAQEPFKLFPEMSKAEKQAYLKKLEEHPTITKPKPAPAVKPTPTLKMWQKPLYDYLREEGYRGEKMTERGYKIQGMGIQKLSRLRLYHKNAVKEALAQGKIPPENVLDSYPELVSKYPKVLKIYPELAEHFEGHPAFKPAPKLAVKEPTAFLDKAERKARERIKKRGITLKAGIDPAEIADYAIIGAAKIGKGAIKFADWSVEMVGEFGDRIKPYLKTIYARSRQELPKFKANAELDSFIDYFEDIQAPKEFRPPRKPARVTIRERLREEGLTGKELTLETDAEFIKAVRDYGIALRQTKTGKIQPAIREAGTYVPEDFATYTDFKDAKAGVGGGTKGATRFVQEIDGALPAEVKAKLPGGAGPAERYILWRVRDIQKFRINWTKAMKARLATITKGLSKEQTKTANQVIEHISRKEAYVDPAKLVTNPKISALTTDLNVIRFAQESRKLYESLLRHQNEARRLRGQKEIPHRDYYTAHSIHEATIWERALGHNKTPEQIIGPGLPDYIKPNAPFNARAMAREIGLPETTREMNLNVLLERYIETAAKDVFCTSIVQNNKAFIQQLKSMGYEHAARGLENWTAEAFTGVKSAVDRVAGLSPTIHKGMNRFRVGLLRSVFPFNFRWNIFIQTSSGVLTTTRYGYRNSVRGMYDWFGSKKIRQEIRDNAYSAIVKSQRSGRISQQDINRGIGAAQRLNRGKLEKASDAANFFTEWVERHLTGWSVATAKRHGASVGLKGKALWEYASDGGAKTQSMYNLEDLPGMLRSEVVKTVSPFQTFSFEVYNTLKEFAGKTGTPPATAAIRTKMVLRFLAGATAVNYIGNAAAGRKPWELSSFIPFYGTFIAPISAALRGADVSMTTTRGLPSPVGIAIKGGQAVHKGLLKPGFAATKEFARTRDFHVALKEFMATGKWDKLRRFTIRYLSGFAGIPGGTQMNRIVDGLIAVSAGGMIDSADRMMFPITDTKDKIRSFLAGPWATKGGQDYWDKRGGELNLDIEFFEENPLLRDVTESIPVFGDFYKFRKDSESQTKQAIRRMLRTGNTEGALAKRIEWNIENPDNRITMKWYDKQLREVAP